MTAPAEPTDGPERLEVRLSANASPKRVAELATMFDEVIAELHVAEAAEITLVVDNRTTRAELRGWDAEGKTAVREVTAIVSNPMRAVQEDHRRAGAARVLATHGRRLAVFQPRFYQGDHPLAAIDEVFIDTMEAVGRISRADAAPDSIFGKLVSARVTGVDPTFQPSSGADLLRDIANSSLPFTRSDYQEALRSLGGDERHDEVLVRMRSSSGKTPMDPIKPRDSKPITLTLQQVLEGTERAERIVQRWPEWKRELSPSTWSERGDRRGPKGAGDR
jgi:hypothetical protein